MMQFIDFHCDTLMRLYDLKTRYHTSKNGGAEAGCSGQAKSPETMWKNAGQVDLERLIKSGYTAQFFACFLWFEGRPVLKSFYEDALAMTDILHEAAAEHADHFSFAGDYRDYLANKAAGKLSGFLTVEEGGILYDKIERLDTLYQRGVRLITLTWNCENCLGYPNIGFRDQDKGLKPFGLEALSHMEELGMIADVSHLSDGGFWDVVKYGKRPFIASHSNARSLLYHARNLTDEMIRAIADKGGVIGLNFGGEFLTKEGKSTAETLCLHARHILSVGGKDILAIGTDFDGVEEDLEIKDCGEMPRFRRELEKAGFTSSEIEGICFRNAEAFMERYWGK